MQTIQAFNLSIQFDGDGGTDAAQQVKEAIELINLTLQREPYGLAAQIFYDPKGIEISETSDGEQVEQECKRCGSELNIDGFCEDETCPFNDCGQSDDAGWEGHPESDIKLND